MTPAELLKELEKDKFRPVYYFYGSEEYRIKEAEKAIAGKFLPKSLLRTNHTVMSATKNKLGEILSELSMFPMLGENQLFTITDIQSLQTKDLEKILALMVPPDPNRLIILTTPSTKTPRKNSKVLNLLSKKTTVVEFGKISGGQSSNKIKAMLSEYKIEIEPEALQMLITLGGGDMGGLIQEIKKLIDYSGENGQITKSDIMAICSDYQIFRIYDLADQVAARNLDLALEIVDSLVKAGETASGITFWLSEHFIDLYLVKNNKPLPAYKSKLAWKFNKQVDLFDNEQLENIINKIAEADLALRSNIKPELAIIEKLILDICLAGEKVANA